jgi:hypothetical protein
MQGFKRYSVIDCRRVTDEPPLHDRDRKQGGESGVRNSSGRRRARKDTSDAVCLT